MKKLILVAMVIGLLISGCSHTAYIREHPDLLKPGLHASAFLEVWGQPDETMSYLDYQNKQYQYSSGGTWGESGGGYFSHGSTYTPQMLVWVYRKYGKILFFSRNRIYSPLSIEAIPVYTPYGLVGWKNIDKKTPASSPSSSTQSNTDWKLCSNNITASVYLNLKSITHPSENIIKGWVKMIYTKEGAIEFVGKFGKQYESLSYSLDIGEINCGEKTGHFLSHIFYDKDGRVISQGIGNFPFPPSPTEWEPIPPDSVADVLYKEVCRNK